MKFMTWTLHAPSRGEFNKFARLQSGAKWYENKFEYVDKENGLAKFTDYRKRSFMEMVIKYPKKFYAIGCHNLGIDVAGNIYGTADVNSFAPDMLALNADQTDIMNPIPESLRWLMHNYPEIKWSLQFLATQERVNGPLWNDNGEQDVMIAQMKKIMQIYVAKGLPIKGVEIDFERTNTSYPNRPTDHITYKNLLIKIKNEVCIPLGLELRVNLFAMTAPLTPAYYGWHDYGTLASGMANNGKRAVDEFQLMTYDFSYGGSAPGPSTPLDWLDSVLTHVNNVLPPEDTFIGNAGYGRRWYLGEDKLGVTLDYKQLMGVQNGMYVHNDGEQDADGNFWFHDQDFHPIGGFNDANSDYQRTFFNVYDRFNLLENGGSLPVAELNTDDNTVTYNSDGYTIVYSSRQFPEFGGIAGVATQPTTKTTNAKLVGSASPTRAKGFETTSFTGYRMAEASTDPVTHVETVPSGSATYDINVPSAGSYHVVAFVTLPFFGKAKQPMTVNGVPYLINGDTERYPFLQSNHFHDCGMYDLVAGVNTITVTAPTASGYNTGPIVYGFVVCQTFDYNFRGGSLDFPTYCQPLLKRDNPDKVVNGIVPKVEAKYPSKFRIVGEILRRTPRPMILWEDRFGTYYDEGTDITAEGDYYPKVADGGYSTGVWKAVNAVQGLYFGHTRVDATASPARMALNNKFSTNIVTTLEANAIGSQPIYGIEINDTATGDKYLANVNFIKQQIRLLKNGVDYVTPIPMEPDFKLLGNDRLALYLYVVDGKLTFMINKTAYFKRVAITHPIGAVYTLYAENCELKVFNYNISSLDRFERMEKVGVEIDGVMHEYGDVKRSTTAIDEFGFLIYTGYPSEASGAVGGLGNTIVGTEDVYISLADKTKYVEMDTDYKNNAIAVLDFAWRNGKNIRFHWLQPAVWLKNFYVGDHEGMSVAYNSDRIGFVKTANKILDARCKGIAMWTLGQEDPTVYTYLPDWDA